MTKEKTATEKENITKADVAVETKEVKKEVKKEATEKVAVPVEEKKAQDDVAEPAKKAKKARLKGGKKKKRRNVAVAIVHLQASFNNVIVSVSDLQGNVIVWSSSGKLGFKGSKKSTPYVAQMVTKDAVDKAKEYGVQSVKVEVTGPGMGRESALKTLADSRLNIISLEEKTYLPHNGCRKKKRRRV